MINIYNYDDWSEYTGASEGSGRSEKVWLINEKSGEIGLFKFPKVSSGDNKYDPPKTSEFISEKLASTIAMALELEAARVEIGYRDGRLGCMSYLILNKNEMLLEGIYLINKACRNFDTDKLYDSETGTYYSFDMVMKGQHQAFQNERDNHIFTIRFIVMMIFDMLIGNSDRHQSNWGLVCKHERKIVKAKFAPLYDNGSSLCAYISEEAAIDFLGNDLNRFESLVTTKSKSRIRIDGNNKKEPNHIEVMEYLKEEFGNVAKIFVKMATEIINEQWIDNTLKEYPSTILGPNKRMLIKKFLLRKVEILSSIFEVN